ERSHPRHQEGPRRRLCRCLRRLQGDAGDQQPHLSRLCRAGPLRDLQLRGGRLPALERRAAEPGPARRLQPGGCRPARHQPGAAPRHQGLPARRPPDGRHPHRRLLHGDGGSGERRRLRTGHPAQGRAPAREDPDRRRRRPSCREGPRADRAEPGPYLRREFLQPRLRQDPAARGAEGLRRLADPLCRAHLQCLDLHGAAGDLDGRGHPRRHHRRHRGAEGPAAWRRQRGRDAHAEGGRRAGAGGGVALLPLRPQGAGDGLRPSRLQERRQPRAHHDQVCRAHGRGGRRPALDGDLPRAGGEDAEGEEHPPEPRFPGRPRLLPDGLRHPALHPDLRRLAHHRLGGACLRAGRRQPVDPPALALCRGGAAPGAAARPAL
ncbi:MAG: 2-methylcitrate synthase, partial [uncultured Craurococcus sp.]